MHVQLVSIQQQQYHAYNNKLIQQLVAGDLLMSIYIAGHFSVVRTADLRYVCK